MPWKDLLNSADEVHDPTGSTLTSTITKEAITELDGKVEQNKTDIGGKLDVGAQAADSALLEGQDGAHYLARGNHTGTDEISDVNGLQAALDAKEDGLGNPATDGFVLSSTIAGVRSWVAQGGGGDVTGPAISVDNRVTLFDGVTGKQIKDSGILISEVLAIPTNGQIAGLSQKVTPAAGDHILIEDSESVNGKKRVLWSQLPGATGGTDLGNVPAPSSVEITSSTGANTTLPAAGANAGVMTAAQVTSLNGKLDASAQAADSALLQGQNGAHYLNRDNHTGLDEISDVNGLQTALDSKLGVSAQAADSALLGGAPGSAYLDRTNHTGQDEISDVNGLQAALDAKEDDLGNPASDGYVLSSTVAGVRSWVDPGGGGGVPEAPAADKSHFRYGADTSWKTNLKAYGDTVQVTGASGGLSPTLANGNVLSSVLTGAATVNDLTATEASQSATWILRHDGNTVGFNAKFKFNKGTAPVAGSGNTWILGLFTIDSGATWIVTAVEEYSL